MDATSTAETSRVFFSDSHVSQLTRSLYDLVKNDVACDVVFTNTKGTNHIAHSVILCAASKFLQRLVAAGRAEASGEAKDKVFVTLDGVHDESISCILKFIYTGEMLLQEYTIKEVYEKCIEWELGEAVKICRRYLQTLPKDYVIDILGLGTALNTIEKEKNINRKSELKTSVDKLLQQHAKLTYYPRNDDIVTRDFSELNDDDCEQDDQHENNLKGGEGLSDNVQETPANNENDVEIENKTSVSIHSKSKPENKNDVKQQKLAKLSRKWNKRQTKALIPKLEKDSIVVIPSASKDETPASDSTAPSKIQIEGNMSDMLELTESVGIDPVDSHAHSINKPSVRGMVTRLRSTSKSPKLAQNNYGLQTNKRVTRGQSASKSSNAELNESDAQDCMTINHSTPTQRKNKTLDEPSQIKKDEIDKPQNDHDELSASSTLNNVGEDNELCDKDYEDADESEGSETEEKTLPPKKRLKRAQLASTGSTGPFCCTHCMKLFKYRTSFQKHITLCEKEKSGDGLEPSESGLPCKQCDEVFDTAGDLKSHMVVHDKPFVCDQCSYRTRRQARLAEHKYRKHGFPLENAGLEIYACKEEGCTFKTVHASVMLAHHNTKHTNGRPFMCETCGATMKSLMSLRQHKRIHTAKHDSYKCDECDATYKSKGALELHVKSRHTKVVDFLCTHCPYGTVSKNTLQSHMLSAHGVIPDGKTVYTCEHCGWQTIIRHLMNKHLTRHKGEKSFECEICHHKFVLAGDLKAHMKRHDAGAPKKKCPFPGCKYTDYGNHKLQQHIRINHTEKGYKPWECHLCDYASAIKGNMTKHLRAVHRLSVTTNQKRLTKITPEGIPEEETEKVVEAAKGTAAEDDKDIQEIKTKEKIVINVNELRRKNQLTESVCTDGFNMGSSSPEAECNSASNPAPQPLPSVVIHHGNVPADNTPMSPPNVVLSNPVNHRMFSSASLALPTPASHMPNPPPYPSTGGFMGAPNTMVKNTNALGNGMSAIHTQHLPLQTGSTHPIQASVQTQQPSLTPIHSMVSSILTHSVQQGTAPSTVQHWPGNRNPLAVNFPGGNFPPPSGQVPITQDIQVQEDIDIEMLVKYAAESRL